MKYPPAYELVLRSASLTLLVFMGIAGATGGLLLIADPSGATLGLAASLLEDTPFTDYLVPGVLLFLIIGMGNLAAAVAVMRSIRWFPFLIAAEGFSITIWILVQMVMVQLIVPQQFVIGIIGLLLIALGILQWEIPERVHKKTSERRSR